MVYAGGSMTEQGEIPHNDFRSGFIAGFQAIAGTAHTIPAIPAQPVMRSNLTPFLMGLRKGLQRAGIDLDSN
jgi:hypothetical protein